MCCILQIFRWATQRALAIGPLGEGGDSGRHTLSAPPKDRILHGVTHPTPACPTPHYRLRVVALHGVWVLLCHIWKCGEARAPVGNEP